MFWLTFRACRGMLVAFTSVESFRVTFVMASSKHDTVPIMRRKESDVLVSRLSRASQASN